MIEDNYSPIRLPGNASTSTIYPVPDSWFENGSAARVYADGVEIDFARIEGEGITTLTPQSADVAITITRETELSQERDFLNNGTLPAEEVESMGDQLQKQIQELKGDQDRTVTFPHGTNLADQANTTIGLDENGGTVARTVEEEIAHLGIGEQVETAVTSAAAAEASAQRAEDAYLESPLTVAQGDERYLTSEDKSEILALQLPLTASSVFPKFTAQTVIFGQAEFSVGNGPVCSRIISTDKSTGFPYAYAMIVSADHALGTEGLYLWVSNEIDSGWKSAGTVLAELTAAGISTAGIGSDGKLSYTLPSPKWGAKFGEFPDIIYFNGQFLISSHAPTASSSFFEQESFILTSQDLVNWTHHANIPMRHPFFERTTDTFDNGAQAFNYNLPGGYQSGAHTGYGRFSIVDGVLVQSITSTTNPTVTAGIVRSYDGKVWEWDDEHQSIGLPSVLGKQSRIMGQLGPFVKWQGSTWGISTESGIIDPSGQEASSREVIMVPVDSRLKPSGLYYKLAGASDIANAQDDFATRHIFELEGKVYCIAVGRTNNSNTVNLLSFDGDYEPCEVMTPEAGYEQAATKWVTSAGLSEYAVISESFGASPQSASQGLTQGGVVATVGTKPAGGIGFVQVTGFGESRGLLEVQQQNAVRQSYVRSSHPFVPAHFDSLSMEVTGPEVMLILNSAVRRRFGWATLDVTERQQAFVEAALPVPNWTLGATYVAGDYVIGTDGNFWRALGNGGGALADREPTAGANHLFHWELATSEPMETDSRGVWLYENPSDSTGNRSKLVQRNAAGETGLDTLFFGSLSIDQMLNYRWKKLTVKLQRYRDREDGTSDWFVQYFLNDQLVKNWLLTDFDETLAYYPFCMIQPGNNTHRSRIRMSKFEVKVSSRNR